ncbi:MAG: thioredoxin fold domain-containing protein [Bacteroidota bacterium]|nr:thioredoxin fold domain-containing protein [Bacteroidota bacterium]
MKKTLILVTALFLVSYIGYANNKIELKWKKYDVGLAEAKKAKKKIIVDVYTDWCKWCKKLDKEVYADDSVAAYLQKQYILVKVNGESSTQIKYKGKQLTEMQLTQLLKVTGFPAIIFLDTSGEVIDRISGFVPADRFLPIVRYIGEDHYKKMTWEEFLNKFQIKGKEYR